MPALLVAALVVFFEGLSFAVTLPTLEPFTLSLGGSKIWVGLLFAIATAPRIFLTPLWGQAADQHGRKPMLIIATTGTAIGSLLWLGSITLGSYLFTGLIWLTIARFVVGIFSAQSVLSMAVASDVSKPEKRAAAFGALGAGFGIAFAIGPYLGGLIQQTWSLSAIGGAACCMQVLSITLIATCLKETREQHADPTDPTQLEDTDAIMPKPATLLEVASFKSVTPLLFICIIGTASYAVLFPTLTGLTANWYNFTITDAGIALSVFGLVGAFVQGGVIRPMSKRLGDKITALTGLLFTAVGLTWLASMPPITGFWASMSITAIGTGLSVPAITALTSKAVTPEHQGAVHGLNQSATATGRAIGFGISGFIAQFFGVNMLYFAAAALGIIAAFYLFSLKVTIAEDPISENSPT